MIVLIVNKQTLEIESSYERETPEQSRFGGAWGNPELTVHIECPEDLDYQCVKAVIVEDEIEIIEDEDKVEAKREKLFEALRKERNKKLSACDWTQLPDSSLSQEDKEAWASYRQELRDLPENTIDPAEIEWPETP